MFIKEQELIASNGRRSKGLGLPLEIAN